MHFLGLRTLELTSRHMTDIGVILGIIYCPALTNLTITAYGVRIVRLLAIPHQINEAVI